MLQHGYLHSHAPKHIDSGHVNAYIGLPALRERDIQFDVAPLLHAAHRNMQPAMRKNGADDSATFPIVLPCDFLHVM